MFSIDTWIQLNLSILHVCYAVFYKLLKTHYTYDNINAYDYGEGISIAKGIKMKTSQNTYVCLQDIFLEKDRQIKFKLNLTKIHVGGTVFSFIA